MRGLSLLDVLVILAVVGLLLFAATRDFGRYVGRTIVSTPPPSTTQPGT